MFCPKVPLSQSGGADKCVVCESDVDWPAGSGYRSGPQFLFADASERKPVALSLDGVAALVLNRSTVISRHVNGIGFGNSWIQPSKFRKEEYKPEVELPRLPPPAGPDLMAVITDRKIYRPQG